MVMCSFQSAFEYFMLLFALDMAHPDVTSKPIVFTNAKPVDVNEVDVDN